MPKLANLEPKRNIQGNPLARFTWATRIPIKGVKGTSEKTQRAILIVLAQYADNHTLSTQRHLHGGMPILMKRTGIKNKHTLIRALEALELQGIIHVKRCKGKSNAYTLQQEPNISPEAVRRHLRKQGCEPRRERRYVQTLDPRVLNTTFEDVGWR